MRLPVPRFRLRGHGLVVVFSVASALIVAGTAVLIGREISQSIALEARKGAENTASVFSRLTLEAEEYSNGEITREGREDLVHDLRRVAAVVGATLWTPERRAEVALGITEPEDRWPGYRSDSPALRAALAGHTRSERTHTARGHSSTESRPNGQSWETLSVYVPILLEAGPTPAGRSRYTFPTRRFKWRSRPARAGSI
jgi:hypothetical protein